MSAEGIYIIGTCLEDRMVALDSSYVQGSYPGPAVRICAQNQVRCALVNYQVCRFTELQGFIRGVVKPA